MESKVWFNIKRITKIRLYYENEVEKTFYPSEPKNRFKFLWLIPLWKQGNFPDRWINNGDDRKSYCYDCNSNYENHERYRIQDFPKKLFLKAAVHIQLDYKDEVSSYFDSDQEAEDFVEDILSQSDHVFEVIKRKQ